MKPIRLSIEGINSFIQRQTLDFSDLGDGLFCISGQTGSGKTTILDSILLALYGDGKRNTRIGEYINMGMEKAEVELDFSVDEVTYRVKRTFSRTGSNKAALYRLDDNHLISDQPSAVNGAIVTLIGLEINAFTQVVILQQGEFDAFLHSSPQERRDTVGKLFKLSRYEKLYSRFNAYYESLKNEIATLDNAATGISYADEEALFRMESEIAELKTECDNAKKKAEELSKRKSELEVIKRLYDESEAKRALAARLTIDREDLKQQIENLNRKNEEFGVKFDLESMRKAEKEAMLEVQRLKGLRPSLKLFIEKKDELEKIRTSYRALDAELKKERKTNELLTENRKKAVALLKQTMSAITGGYKSDFYYSEQGFAELKSFLSKMKVELTTAENVRKNIAEVSKERDEAVLKRAGIVEAYRQLYARENDTQIALNRAEDKVEDRQRELNDLRSVKALSSVISELRIGDNCPVCGNRITFLKTAEAEDFTQAEAELNKAEAEAKKLREALSAIKVETARVQESSAGYEKIISNCDEKLKELTAALKIQPTANFKNIENAEKCSEVIEDTDKEIINSRHKIELKSAELENVSQRGVALRADIDKLTASLEGITAETDIDMMIDTAERDAAAKSRELSDAEKDTESIKNSIVEAEKKFGAVQAQLDNINDQLSQRIEYDAAEYILTNTKLSEAERQLSEVTTAYVKKNAQIETARRDAELLKNLKSRRAVLEKNADRASKLAKLVKGDGFLDFVAREYVESFTASASEIMLQLSSGQYSLELGAKGEFLIRDFFRENSLRSVGTLSGGETFLASLSMAVAISRELSQYTGCGFFFLDEGFGTLDEDYILTVYEALQNLSKETMVGLVTHCKELIDLIGNSVEILKADGETGSKIIGK